MYYMFIDTIILPTTTNLFDYILFSVQVLDFR